MTPSILQIAVPSPLRRTFDYLSPRSHQGPLQPGVRVRVPFGRRSVIGVLLAVGNTSEVPAQKLRAAEAVLDEEPLLLPDVLALLAWAAGYYHHPVGEVVAAALPTLLRQGGPAVARGLRRWSLTARGEEAGATPAARAPRQTALLALLRAHGEIAEALLDARESSWRPVMRRLQEKGWVTWRDAPCLEVKGEARTDAPALNADQALAVEAVTGADGYCGSLLDGVTGSGKTEVYLRIIERTLAQGRQALLLTPEIGLTPQLVARFEQRFKVPIAVLHSGLNDTERHCAWLMARSGEAPVVIGTRSAVFTPLKRPGVIIVDEEHDPSYKQQEGFRYSARDLAVMRARRAGIAVVLGSATPSFESLRNVALGRYRRLALPERAGSARLPDIQLLDVRRQPMEEGLSQPLLKAMEKHLAAGGQVLLFLNRRGFAPTLLCHDCGWVALCTRCDAHLTLHQSEQRLRCHHCGAEHRIFSQCKACGSVDLRALGLGTERIERVLRQHFPQAGIVRVDRDSTRRKGAMERLLEQARSGEGRILIGTQMLAKGHHLPEVSLVGILDADQGLYGADFRAGERMAQLIVQVTGRAGRAERPGTVLIQTHHPDHPLLRQLVEHGYHDFAAAALEERRQALWPPFSHLALLRAEAVDVRAPLAFLEAARGLAKTPPNVSLLGPVAAPMQRRAGRHRAQLLVQAPTRGDLQGLLGQWVPQLETLKQGRRVRWSLDIDPADIY